MSNERARREVRGWPAIVVAVLITFAIVAVLIGYFSRPGGGGSGLLPPLRSDPGLEASLAGRVSYTGLLPDPAPYGTPAQLPSQQAIGYGANANAWAAEILGTIGAPIYPPNIASLVDWFGEEDAHGSAGRYAAGIGQDNPLSITADTPGITGASGSVTSGGGGPPNLTFPTVTAGINALSQALPNYPVILSALRSGAGLIGNKAVSPELQEWSGNGYSSVKGQ